jgi:hypothetical protein
MHIKKGGTREVRPLKGVKWTGGTGWSFFTPLAFGLIFVGLFLQYLHCILSIFFPIVLSHLL